MTTTTTTTVSLALFLVLLCNAVARNVKAREGHDSIRKPYIVHMMKSVKPHHFSLHEHWYASLLNGVSSSDQSHSLLLYTYNKALHGFAAKLTSAEAGALESTDGCLAVIPSSVNKIHTTHSPQFLGLVGGSNGGAGLWSQYADYGEDVIVGVVDTGIWPESASFHDGGLGPVPSRWKGECESGEGFDSSNCNRKLIGARFNFSAGYKSHYIGEDFISPRDIDGHGSHTASTAAGSAVSGASFNGFAMGTATGMAPAARLAVYKACWGAGCDESDIVAAMESAIEDGVDIISVSLGGPERDLFSDQTGLAAFGAMEKGVFVSASSGNGGPLTSSVSNTAPWITTVGASSIDREFPSPVKLGNGAFVKGSSFYRGIGIENLALVYDFCSSQGLDPHIFKGKIVLCPPHANLSETARLVKEAGAAGMIVANDEFDGAQDQPIDQSYLPATSVSFSAGEKMKAYVNSTATPTASINPTGMTVLGQATAPIVAAFSSRGPSLAFPHVLKPDIIAPGVNILAAWTNGSYKIISGTSMSCPHVSGIAALIRSAHPTWSPAAIKSALMTSSSTLDNRNRPIEDALTLQAADPFAMGAGHVNPTAAMNPGLVYDMAPQDYINFLCALNVYTEKQMAMLSHKRPPCPKSEAPPPADLNYPSISVIVSENGEYSQVRRRTVTNVGGENSMYEVRVKSSSNVKVSVVPNTLVLRKQYDKANFNVTFQGKMDANASVIGEFGDITWECIQGGTHVVHTPFVVQYLLLEVDV